MSAAVVIVGATSGIGKALAREWASNGHALVLAARDAEEVRRAAADIAIRYGTPVSTVIFDALAFDTHDAFFKDCVTASPEGLQGMIVCHGLLIPQAEAQADQALLRLTIDTNFTSAASILNLAATYFEDRGNGFICVFSSVAGDRGRQGNYAYGSAKAGLTAYLQGLRVRLFKSGVSVLTIKPGFVDTAMTWGLPGMFLVASPQRVAVDVWRATQRGRMTIYTPWFWRWIMLIIRSIPEGIFRRLKL